MPRVVALALSALLFFSSSSFATTVQKFTLRDLATLSRSVVVARVTATESRWDGGEIYTYATIQVADGLKGARKGQILIVRQLGGQVGDLASIVPGMPSFKTGEEVVLFLSANDKTGHPWVVGLEQGKYTISSDKNGKKRVRRNTADLSFAGPASDAGGALPEEAPLEMFLNEVREELGIPVNALPSEGSN